MNLRGSFSFNLPFFFKSRFLFAGNNVNRFLQMEAVTVGVRSSFLVFDKLKVSCLFRVALNFLASLSINQGLRSLCGFSYRRSFGTFSGF